MTGSVVVIGYGNTLRGDDGVGPLIAEAVARWNLPHVRGIAVHQLTPELADAIASACFVVFVDASASEGEVSVRPIEPSRACASPGHVCDPGWLLGLAEAVQGHVPQAVLVTVPGSRFNFGAELSATAAAGMATALDRIATLAS